MRLARAPSHSGLVNLWSEISERTGGQVIGIMWMKSDRISVATNRGHTTGLEYLGGVGHRCPKDRQRIRPLSVNVELQKLGQSAPNVIGRGFLCRSGFLSLPYRRD
ncbi:MAG: hypothetical protein ACI8TP_001811 [Acidimicrobiales bacterium]|jgi:hypothetical protein